jgi:hypothetical protein
LTILYRAKSATLVSGVVECLVRPNHVVLKDPVLLENLKSKTYADVKAARVSRDYLATSGHTAHEGRRIAHVTGPGAGNFTVLCFIKLSLVRRGSSCSATQRSGLGRLLVVGQICRPLI